MDPADQQEFEHLHDELAKSIKENADLMDKLRQAQERLRQHEKQFREIAQRASQAAVGMP